MNWLALVVTLGSFAALAAAFALLRWAEKRVDSPKLADPVDAHAATVPLDEDTVPIQRAAPWTGEETQPVTAGSPAIVAGDDLVVSQFKGWLLRDFDTEYAAICREVR